MAVETEEREWTDDQERAWERQGNGQAVLGEEGNREGGKEDDQMTCGQDKV